MAAIPEAKVTHSPPSSAPIAVLQRSPGGVAGPAVEVVGQLLVGGPEVERRREHRAGVQRRPRRPSAVWPPCTQRVPSPRSMETA